MRTLKRPMFKKGGSANEGIMTGLVDRKQYAGGGTIGGGTIQGTPMGYRTGFQNPLIENVRSALQTGNVRGEKVIEQAKRFANLRNLGVWGTGVTAALPTSYVLAAEALQSSIPKSLQSSKYGHGTTGIYDRATFPDAMAAGADIAPEVDEILRIGDVEGRKDPMGSGFYDTLIEQGGGLTEEAQEKRKIERLSKKLEKEGTGSLDDIKIKETIADKRSRLNKRAKEFLDILSPEAQKRALIDSAAAASEALGQSTGDTKQDIANAITAAAKVSGGTRDIVDKARLLAIQEDIQKGLKVDKVSETDKLWSKWVIANPKKEGESMPDYYARILEKMSTGKIPVETKLDHIRIHTTAGETKEDGLAAWAKKKYGTHKDFGGIIDKENMPKLVEGKKYYDPETDDWKTFKGEPTTAPGE